MSPGVVLATTISTGGSALVIAVAAGGAILAARELCYDIIEFIEQ